MDKQELTHALDKVAAAQISWAVVDFASRASVLNQVAVLLRVRKQEYARLMAKEMGKPVSQGEAEIEKCAWVCEYYAEYASTFLADEVIATDYAKSYVHYAPLGVVLAVMPWNFPFWQVLRFAAPALMAGNGAVLKHASNVSGCATAIQQLFEDAGLTEHLFRTVLIDSRQVVDVIAHDAVRAVTLTGSGDAGRAVAVEAGRHLKKVVLELGGSDPYLILEDADLGHAAALCVQSRMISNGQSCIAAKRFIAVAEIYGAFVEKVKVALEEYSMGDPFKEETKLGPMVSEAARDDLHQQVQASVSRGARCLLGGEIPNREGAFYPATLLVDVVPGMPAYMEELFGPVASVISAIDMEDAIKIANDSAFGLGAGVFTADLAKGEQIARERLESGAAFVNDFVKSDPRLPFGGIKESGFGRELASHGIREFVNVKTVVVTG